MTLLKKDDINKKLNNLNGWRASKKSIYKSYELKDFSGALAFVLQIGIEAEKADHHPDIKIHSWNKVNVTLSTHSEGGITIKDIKLATAIEKL